MCALIWYAEIDGNFRQVWLATTRYEALQCVHRYIKRNWLEWLGEYPEDDPDEAWDLYWQAKFGKEWCTITALPVEGWKE